MVRKSKVTIGQKKPAIVILENIAILFVFLLAVYFITSLLVNTRVKSNHTLIINNMKQARAQAISSIYSDGSYPKTNELCGRVLSDIITGIKRNIPGKAGNIFCESDGNHWYLYTLTNNVKDKGNNLYNGYCVDSSGYLALTFVDSLDTSVTVKDNQCVKF